MRLLRGMKFMLSLTNSRCSARFIPTFRNCSIIIAVAGVPGVLLGTALIEIPHFGRKWSMVLSSALMATSLFLYSVITTPAASVGFNAMEYWFQRCVNPARPVPMLVDTVQAASTTPCSTHTRPKSSLHPSEAPRRAHFQHSDA